MKRVSVFVLLFSCAVASADMSPEVLLQPEDWVVLENQWTNEVTLEDPVFSARASERTLAAFAEEVDDSYQDGDLSGQLSVQKEIPYTYPSLTRRTLQLRTLAEIEEKEKKTQ